MAQIALSLGIILVVYLIGYAMGRKDIINDLKSITKEINELDNKQDSNK